MLIVLTNKNINKYYERIGTEVTEIELPFSFPESWAIVKLHSISALIDGEKRTGNYICLDAKYLCGATFYSGATFLTKNCTVFKNPSLTLSP